MLWDMHAGGRRLQLLRDIEKWDKAQVERCACVPAASCVFFSYYTEIAVSRHLKALSNTSDTRPSDEGQSVRTCTRSTRDGTHDGTTARTTARRPPPLLR